MPMARFVSFVLTTLLFASISLTAATADSSLALSTSKWIWNSATAIPNALLALRKDFTPPLGKALIGAEIVITGDDIYELYVNGDYVGSSTPVTRPRFAQRFCVDLLPSFNVFAVNASTTGSGADSGGLLATILLTYTDGSTDTLVTDSSWRAKSGLPLGWETLAFDDTAWPVATVVGSYGVAPWDNVLVNIPADPPVLSFERAVWIWTDVVPASGILPAGSRAFRRSFPLGLNQTPSTATILISADNEYTLYANGVTIGSGSNFKIAQRYTVNFKSAPTELVFAVIVTNTAASTAGLLVSMEVNMVPTGRTNCTAGGLLLTDAGWKSTKGSIPIRFEQPGFDDSAWPAVVQQVSYPAAPWAH
ncbi:hypothetical protein B0H16DRAFT_1799871 [Mycena metata]|uniref:Uncharacterized protein n=1 Tax=Mycena metata TaxID=1033252 RepID=A0AAD7JGM0_9AGAR|nr:hypothetical protein B0H16DRAFT_1799871 [Mycena metata]